MDAGQIQLELKKLDLNMSDFARSLKVSRAAVSAVVGRRGKSRKIAQAIAIVLKKDLEVVFPGEYPDDYQEDRRIRAADRMSSLLSRSIAA